MDLGWPLSTPNVQVAVKQATLQPLAVVQLQLYAPLERQPEKMFGIPIK